MVNRQAATFGWLCVETEMFVVFYETADAATFGWLCVETFFVAKTKFDIFSSHLRVAVC